MSSNTSKRFRQIGLIAFGSVFGVLVTLAVLVGLNTLTGDSNSAFESNVSSTAESRDTLGKTVRSKSAGSNNRAQDLGLLNFLVRAPSAFARTEALYTLLQSADENLLTQLFEQSEKIGSRSLQHSTQTAIVQRLTTIDSKLALTAIDELPSDRRIPLISTVFGEWSLIDIDAVIAHAKTLEQPRRHAALQGILNAQDSLPQGAKEDIADSLQIDLKVIEQERSLVSLSEEWQDLLVDEQPNEAQTEQLLRLAHKWVDLAGLGAIAQIEESLKDFNLKNAVLGSVLQRAMLYDPHSTLQQAMELEGDLRELTLETIARVWASINPQVAVESISSIESHRIRRQMLEQFVTAWAQYDPKGMFEKFDLIPENLRSYAEEHAIRAIAKTTPEDAVQFLADVSDKYLKFDLTMELATHWSDQDALAALTWALSEQVSSTSLERQVLNTVIRSLAKENPALALQTALEQPTDLMGLGLEVTVIEEVARTDLERAISMLSQVRDGWTQSSSYVAVGKALVRNSEIDRALELSQQLPEENRDLYYNLVVNEWAYSNPKSLVAELDNLPSAEAKFTAAMDLTRMNVGTNVLTKDQMSYVKGFLPKDYNSETGRRGAESARFARLNSIHDKELTEEERKQIQRDFQKVLTEGRYRIYRGPSQALK